MAYYKENPKLFFMKVYHGQISSSKTRNMPKPNYSFEQFIDWLKQQSNLTQIWEEYQNSKHDRNYAPSIDRIDDSVSYTLSNIRLVTWRENYMKARQHMRLGLLGSGVSKAKPVLQYQLDGTFIARFFSSQEAEEKTGAYNTNIRACCNGKLKTASKFIWKWEQ